MIPFEPNRMPRSSLGLYGVCCIRIASTCRRAPMWKLILQLLTATTVASWLGAAPAQAQATRTYVSGVGKDSNPCTAAAPCQTLQKALAQTLAGGQIYALDSANYG